jgi:hypothetical protein
VAFYAAASVLLSPWVALMFGLAVTHLSYLFFVALPPALAVALAIHRGALSHAAGHLWTWRPSLSSLAWIGGAFAWLTVAGALVSTSPFPVALSAAGISGLLNARAYFGLVQSMATVRRPAGRGRRHLVPVALATTFAVAIGGTQIGFAATGKRFHPGSDTGPILVGARGHPVLVAGGYGTRWDPRPVLRLPNGYVAWRYSYLGLDALNRSVPYDPADTLQPLLVSARMMGQQVHALARAYREPVTIIAESEGALVARTFLLRVYRPESAEVDRLVILDMPNGASSVYYPRAGVQGWGVGSGWALRGLARLISHLGPLPVSADAPILRDFVECRNLISGVLETPPPKGVREFSIQALADAVDDSDPRALPGAVNYIVTAAHGGLVRRTDVQDRIFESLADVSDVAAVPSVGSFRMRLARLVAAASEPWQTPGLATGLAPSGRSC